MVDPIDGQGAKLNIFKKSIFIEISIKKKIKKNVFEKILLDERSCCKCEKYYKILVHNLKTSKTGVFDVIRG